MNKVLVIYLAQIFTSIKLFYKKNYIKIKNYKLHDITCARPSHPNALNARRGGVTEIIIVPCVRVSSFQDSHASHPGYRTCKTPFEFLGPYWIPTYRHASNTSHHEYHHQNEATCLHHHHLNFICLIFIKKESVQNIIFIVA